MVRWNVKARHPQHALVSVEIGPVADPPAFPVCSIEVMARE